ncbi:hypothetical protein OE88DRAFT_1059173 [Heliocybe sulcata]|uniref:Uncharacterized protein n=1 Tax=Heliocybe sulcata TaxID=5364 RepID=A0A5C3ML04_9AGAM|nr:hypothetical protein OE88DRAFT_1059173 [Heliocybe sulcata]
MSYDAEDFHICALSARARYLPAVWGCQIAFDVYIFALSVINAAERPRRAESPLMSGLYRDGVFFFAALFWLRVANMTASGLPDVSYNLLLSFSVWPMTILTTSRLILRMEAMKYSIGESFIPMTSLPGTGCVDVNPMDDSVEE